MFVGAVVDCSEKARQTIDILLNADIATKSEALASGDWQAFADWRTEDLVVFGRIVERQAEHDDPVARGLLADLRDRAASIPRTVAEPFYLGALGALYFDDEGNRRPLSGTVVANVLLDLVTIPEFARAAEAVGKMLNDRGGPALFTPGGGARKLELEVITHAAADGRSPSDLVAIRLKGHDLTTDLQDEEALRFEKLLTPVRGTRDFTVAALLDVVARFHLLPRHLVSSAQNPTSLVRAGETAGVELEP